MMAACRDNIDPVDRFGFTPLMWIVYSFQPPDCSSLCRAFKKFGANLDSKDNVGVSVLEWAKRRGDRETIEILGCTSPNAFHAQIQSMLLPVLSLVIIIISLCLIPFPWSWISSVALVIIVHIISQVEMKSAYMFSLLLSSEVMVTSIYLWIYIAYQIPLSLWDGCTLVIVSLTIYFHLKTSLVDPGFISSPESCITLNKIILDLAGEGLLDRKHFCINCLIRRPIRSKHCRTTDKCVLHFDQYEL
jgi:ribosomal protein L40E